MAAIDWGIVLVLNLGVVAYGLYLARGTTTSGEWFLGARALPWWIVGLSMFATNIDNADVVSVVGTASTEGVHIITVHTIGSVLGGIVAAFFVVPAMYHAGFYTNAEYLEARFGVSTRVLSALIQIQYRSSMLGLMIWSIYLLLTQLVGTSTPVAWTLIVAMVILAALYTAWGGLRSVVLTDAVQGIVMMAGALVILAAVWDAVGGWSGMATSLEAADAGSSPIGRSPSDLPHVGTYRGDHGNTSPIIVCLGWTIIAGGYWTVNHTQTMRLMGSRSLWDVKMAALLGTAVSVPIMIGCALLGVFGRALYPGLEPADEMYPRLAGEYLGPGLTGLVVAGVLAAAISTFDSMGSALSALFTRDIYARLLVRHRDDGHYVTVSRCATVAILALGFLYLPFIRTKKTMLEAFLNLIPVFVTPLFVLYLAGTFTRAHRRSGIVGLVCGGLYGVVAFYDRQVSDVAWLAPWFTNRWAALVWSMVITGALMALTTFFLGRDSGESRATTDAAGWLARSREKLPEIREHPFDGRIPALLNPAWMAVALLALTAYLVFVVFW